MAPYTATAAFLVLRTLSARATTLVFTAAM
jgi:hypothetical protein